MFNRWRRKESQVGANDGAAFGVEEPVSVSSTSGSGHNVGFICPDCLQSFVTAEGLQGHFEEAHLAPEASVVSAPILDQHQSTAESLPPEVLALDINGATPEQLKSSFSLLQSALKEEQLLCASLKQQADEKASLTRRLEMNQEELRALRQMFEGAEDSRQHATAEVVRLKEALLLIEDADSDPNKVASRAAQMAVETANLRQQVDFVLARNKTLQDQVEKMEADRKQQSMERAASPMSQDSSSANDDVLQASLARAQQQLQTSESTHQLQLTSLQQQLENTQADLKRSSSQLTELELWKVSSAAEVERLEFRCHDLQCGLDKAPSQEEFTRKAEEVKRLELQLAVAPGRSEIEKYEQRCVLLEADLAKAPGRDEFDRQADRIASLEIQLAEAPRQHELTKLQLELQESQTLLTQRPTDESLASRDAQIEQLKLRLSAAPAGTDITRLESEVHSLKEELAAAPKQEQLQNMQTSLTEALQLGRQLQQQLLEKESRTLQLQQELQQGTASSEELKGTVTRLQADLETANTHIRSEATAKGAAEEDSRRLNSLLSAETEKCQARDQQLRDTNSQLGQLKENLEHMDGERKNLIRQIEAGEGVTTAIQQLTEDKESLRQLTTSLETSIQTQASEHAVKLEELSQQKAALRDDLAENRAKRSSAEQQVLSLETKLTSLQGQCGQIKDQLDGKVAELSAEQLQKAEVQATLTVLRQQSEQQDKNFQRSQQQWDDLQQAWNTERSEKGVSIESLQHQVNGKAAELQEKLLELQAVKAERDAANRQVSHAADLSTSQTEQIAKLSNELQALESSVNEQKLSMASSEQEKKRGNERIAELTDGLAAVQEQARNEKSILEEAIQASKKHNNHLEGSMAGLSAQLKQKQDVYDGVVVQLSTAREQLATEQQRCVAFETAISEKGKDVESMTRTWSEKERGFNEQLKIFQDELLNLTVGVEKAKLELSQALEERDGLRHEAAAAKQQLSAEQSKSSNLSGELQVQQSSFAEMTRRHEATVVELADLRSSAKESEEMLNMTVTQLSETKDSLSKQLLQMDDELSTTKSTLASTCTKLMEVTTALSSAETSLTSTEEKRATFASRCDHLETSLKTEEQAREKLSAELTQARAAFESTKSSNEETIRQLKSETDKLQASCSQLEQEGEKEQARLRVQITNLQSNIGQCKATETQLQEQLKESEERRDRDVSALGENLTRLRIDGEQKRMLVESLEDANSKLKAGMAESRQQAQDEQRVLLERCVVSEEEGEKLQGRLHSVEKDLMETQAALREMGQQNQTFQVHKTMQGERHWQSDERATNCRDCSVKFSVAVRKHHCRNCGCIFCDKCTAKTAKLPSGKKPVRVCGRCYGDLTI